MEDKHLKRAGLDYWPLVDIHYYENFQELINKYTNKPFILPQLKQKNSIPMLNMKMIVS